MKKNFIAKSALILSIFLLMLGLVGCSDDMSDQDSDHGTAQQLMDDPGCAEPCHTDDVLYDEE